MKKKKLIKSETDLISSTQEEVIQSSMLQVPDQKIMKHVPNFSAVPHVLHDLAWEAWEAGDISRIMGLTGHEHRGRLLCDNLDAFKSAGGYEAALYYAFTHGPTMRPKHWQYLFSLADRKKLIACGDPIPPTPIEVYRGVSDCRLRSWIRGMSWTRDPKIAAWFATSFATRTILPLGAIPAVYSLRVNPEQILCITNERSEEEVIVAAWECGRMKRLDIMPESIGWK